MSSKREQESSDDAIHNLTAKGGVQNTSIRYVTETNQGHFNRLPVILSGNDCESSQTQRDNSGTVSAITSTFDVSGCITSQLPRKDFTDLQSSNEPKGKHNERTSTFRHGLEVDTVQQQSNKWATGDNSMLLKSLHIINESQGISIESQSQNEDIKSVHFEDTSDSYGDYDNVTLPKIKASGKFIGRSRIMTKRLSPSKPGVYKPMLLKTLQFKTQQINPKSLSRFAVFKALQLRENTPILSQKHILKTVDYDDKLFSSKRRLKKTQCFETKITVPVIGIESEYLNIVKPMKLLGTNKPSNTKFVDDKPLQSGEKNPIEKRELNTQLTKPSEHNVVVRPLQFYETATDIQPTYLEPTPGTSKISSLPVKPAILKPLHFYQTAMGPVHFFDECETNERSILSPKLKILEIPQTLQSKTDIKTGYRSVVKEVKFTGNVKPIQLAISIEPNTKHLRDVKKTETYSLDAESVEFSETVQQYSISTDSADIHEFSKVALQYPPSAECVVFSEPVQPCPPSVESAETKEFFKLTLPYLPSAECMKFSESVPPYPPGVESVETQEVSKLALPYVPSAESVQFSEPIRPYPPSVESVDEPYFQNAEYMKFSEPILPYPQSASSGIQEFSKRDSPYLSNAEYVELSESIQPYPQNLDSAEIQEFSKLALPCFPGVERVEFSESVQPYPSSVDSAEIHVFSKPALCYAPSADCVESSKPVQFYPPVTESTETRDFSKLAPSHPSSAESIEVSSGTPEQATTEFPQTITLETLITKELSLNEQFLKDQFSAGLSSEENFLNLVQKSYFSSTLKPSPLLTTKTALQDNVITCTKSDVITSTRNTKKVTLDETVIDLSNLNIITSSNVDTQEQICTIYDTPEVGTSKGLDNIGYDTYYDEYEYDTDSDIEDEMLSEILKSDTSGLYTSETTVLRNFSSIIPLEQAILIDIPEHIPSMSDMDSEELSEVHQEMMQSRHRVRFPYNMMTTDESFVKTLKEITTSDDSVRTGKRKKTKGGKIKKPDKFSPNPTPKPEAPKVKTKKRKLRIKKKKRIYTKRAKTRLVDSKAPALTGYFRDRKRRIDMVFVADNTDEVRIERLKVNFLRNVAASGLEMEFEMPVQNRFCDLLFIKAHAPDDVLIALAKHYGMMKEFKDDHLAFIEETVFKEMGLIKGLRACYPGPGNFSTQDRIALVYRLLRTIPFGDPQNYRGVDRLMEAGILRDCFPLHDGPFFMLSKKRQKKSQINGRQALFYTWASYFNIASRQPVHLIREYMGERIAFLFAFFQFYIYSLLLPSCLGLFFFAGGIGTEAHDFVNNESCTKYGTTFVVPAIAYDWGTFAVTLINTYSTTLATRERNISIACLSFKYWPCPYNYGTVVTAKWFLVPQKYSYYATMTRLGYKVHHYRYLKTVTYYDMPICPTCSDFQACPFINLSYYCERAKFKNKIDNPYSIIFCAVFAIWGFLFVRLWRRRENYLAWLWEVKEEEWNLKRFNVYVVNFPHLIRENSW